LIVCAEQLCDYSIAAENQAQHKIPRQAFNCAKGQKEETVRNPLRKRLLLAMRQNIPNIRREELGFLPASDA
jgi:hypothetical protein